MIHRANARKGEAPAVRMKDTDGFTEVNLKINPKAATRAPEQGVRASIRGEVAWAGSSGKTTTGGRRA